MAKGKKTKVKPTKEQNQDVAATETQVIETNEFVTVEEQVIPEVTTPEVQVDVSKNKSLPVTPEKTKAVDQTEPVFCLEDAIRTLIFEPKDHWMASIKIRAGLMGINIHKFYPMNRWKDVLIAWGGHGYKRRIAWKKGRDDPHL